jgi:hypothetical protein
MVSYQDVDEVVVGNVEELLAMEFGDDQLKTENTRVWLVYHTPEKNTRRGDHSAHRVSPTQRADIKESKCLLCFDKFEAGNLAWQVCVNTRDALRNRVIQPTRATGKQRTLDDFAEDTSRHSEYWLANEVAVCC